jgi:hypothetical protein
LLVAVAAVAAQTDLLTMVVEELDNFFVET